MDKKFIYLSTSCTKSRFYELQKQGINRDVPQAQKYHRLLIEGLSKNQNSRVDAISLIPTNREWCKKLYFTRDEEYVNEDLKYIYVPFINIPIIKQILLKHTVKKELLKEIKTHQLEEIYMVCDIWNQVLSECARNIGRKTGIKVIGIVTDVPKHRSNAYNSSRMNIKSITKDYVENRTYKNASKYDYYLLLTRAMNDVVNPKHMPFVVLEGHSDLDMKEISNDLTQKSYPKVMLYAGTLHREYGIEMLINAFLEGNYEDWEFHIYGKGNYEKSIKRICNDHPQIKYFGLADNNYIISEQIKATLIVNPRPTIDDYVKYSFPSKTLEAMASGTPLLSTKLPGIPVEYFEYIYSFEDESINGFKTTLDNILHKNTETLHEKGAIAKKFAITQKNNCVQAQKIIDMIRAC